MPLWPHVRLYTRTAPYQLYLVMLSTILPATFQKGEVILAHLCDVRIPLQP